MDTSRTFSSSDAARIKIGFETGAAEPAAFMTEVLMRSNFDAMPNEVAACRVFYTTVHTRGRQDIQNQISDKKSG